MLGRSVADNLTLSHPGPFSRAGVIHQRRQHELTRDWMTRLDVRARDAAQPIGELSGGNQQKIAVAKWLFAESRILLLFDPTRGIDVGTKHELYVLMRAFAESGGSILFHSTEIPELVHLCAEGDGELAIRCG